MKGFMGLQDYLLSIAPGASLVVPGGNYLFVYSLSGVTELTAQFYDGDKATAKSLIREGLGYGDGTLALDGGLLFDKIVLTNNGAATATAVLYISDRPVKSQQFSGAVTLTGVADTDVQEANRTRATEQSQDQSGGEVKSFYASYAASTNGAAHKLLFVVDANQSGDAPKQILIEEIRGWAETPFPQIRVGNNTNVASVTATGTACGNANVMPLNGQFSDLFPSAAAGANREWVRTVTSGTLPSHVILGTASAGHDVVVDLRDDPIVVENVGASDFAIRHISLVDQNGGSFDKGNLTVRGRVVT